MGVPAKTNGKHYDVGTVKQAAAGRWPEILSRLGGLPIDTLDGNHHPCPRCGGTDRFRMVDAAAGAVFCNQCFSKDNGDGLAALGHYCGWTFPQTLQFVGEHLGVHPSANGCNGHAKSNGKPKKATDEASLTKGIKPVDHKPEIVEVFLSKYGESKPPITADGIRRCGGSLVDWMGFRSIRLDGRTPIDSPTITAVVLLKLDGEPFPAFGKVGERKTHTVKGSVNSWLASGDVTTAETVLDVEGVTDLLAAVSAGLPQGWGAVTNTSGAKARGKLPRPWAAVKKIIVVGDADEPGQEGTKRCAAAYYQAGASEVLSGQLPYEIEKDHGKDLRDWLLEGHTVADLPTVAVTAEDIAAWETESKTTSEPHVANAITIDDAEGGTQVIPLAMDDVIDGIFRATGGWPMRVGESLFVQQDETVAYLNSTSSLFGWLGHKAGIVQWSRCQGCVTKDENRSPIASICRRLRQRRNPPPLSADPRPLLHMAGGNLGRR